MSDERPDNDGLEARLRWLAERIGQSVEELGELDIDPLARLAGIEPERARELLDDAGRWISGRADDLVDEAVARFGNVSFSTSAFTGFRANASATSESPQPPHPLDLPTAEQGRALSAIDSGRWVIEPGSHAVSVRGDGPVPADAVGLVSELRVRDWIGASGELTMVGSRALARWIEAPDAG